MPVRAHRLAALLCAGVMLGCSERTLDDELERFCADHCSVSLECFPDTESRDLDECIDECIPSTKKQRSSCVASYETSVCWSKLSCEQADAYAAGLASFLETGEFGDFPCKDEVVNALAEC